MKKIKFCIFLILYNSVINANMDILESAAINRETAAMARIEYAHKQIIYILSIDNNDYSVIGKTELIIAEAYGSAALNLDKATINRISMKEKGINNKKNIINMGINADDLIKLAGDACERASSAFNNVEDTAGVSTACQQAAKWKEMLYVRKKEKNKK